jgi:hypothetical protein
MRMAHASRLLVGDGWRVVSGVAPPDAWVTVAAEEKGEFQYVWPKTNRVAEMADNGGDLRDAIGPAARVFSAAVLCGRATWNRKGRERMMEYHTTYGGHGEGVGAPAVLP